MNRILSFFLLLVIMGCLSKDESSKKFDEYKTAFITDWNLDTTLHHYYWRQGALFVEDQIYKNRDSIQIYFQKKNGLKSFETIAIIQHDSANYFDVGYYNVKDSLHQQLAYVIAWKKEGGQWLKELEVIYPVDASKQQVLDEIDEARREWENLSNRHTYRTLVQELYQESSFYLNDGYIYEGIDPITQKYAYMEKENWHIRLATIQTLQVSDSLCYDVGKYVSSGKGHYLILWQLQESGQWHVLLDFNF